MKPKDPTEDTLNAALVLGCLIVAAIIVAAVAL